MMVHHAEVNTSMHEIFHSKSGNNKFRNLLDLRDEWPSGLETFSHVTEVKLGRVWSNSGWVTSEA